jgi:uncharacterized protein (TIGR03083 family)
MADVAQLYREGRGRISDLVRDLDEANLQTKVPGCPEWSVRDLVSHLSGVCNDIIEGRIEGVASEPWTAAQIEARRDWPIEQILAEWDEFAPQCEAICHMFPDGSDVQWLADLTTHEHDIRGALGRPGERDSDALILAFAWLVERFGAVLSSRDAPALRVLTTQGDDLVAGKGEPVASVRADRFDLFRALTGRRSLDQVFEFDWQGDFNAHRESLEAGWGPFTPAAAPVSY